MAPRVSLHGMTGGPNLRGEVRASVVRQHQPDLTRTFAFGPGPWFGQRRCWRPRCGFDPRPVHAHCTDPWDSRADNRPSLGAVVTKHQPTPEERDERIKLDVPPEKFVEGVLQTGPHPGDEQDEERAKMRAGLVDFGAITKDDKADR